MNELEIAREMRRRTRRSLLTGGIAALLGGSTWAWLRTRPSSMDVPWPFRQLFLANEKIWRALYRPGHSEPALAAPPAGQAARVNSDIGIEEPLDLATWQLRVLDERDQELHVLRMPDLLAFPRADVTATFKCIEGWSEVMSFGGVRFTDFMRRYGLPNSRYVGLETANREYYVSIDMESMRHPNTLLSYAMNGTALGNDHGAPLRLFIPVKYGIKNLKRVETIRFSNERLPDYWAEQGYDWYAAL